MSELPVDAAERDEGIEMRTREQDHEMVDLKWEWLEATERGEPFEVEYSTDGGKTWGLYTAMTWADDWLYRRKPEPEKPFRRWVNIIPRYQQVGEMPCVVLHATQTSAQASASPDATQFALLPADDLARLERELGEMLAVLTEISVISSDLVERCRKVSKCDS